MGITMDIGSRANQNSKSRNNKNRDVQIHMVDVIVKGYHIGLNLMHYVYTDCSCIMLIGKLIKHGISKVH